LRYSWLKLLLLLLPSIIYIATSIPDWNRCFWAKKRSLHYEDVTNFAVKVTQSGKPLYYNDLWVTNFGGDVTQIDASASCFLYRICTNCYKSLYYNALCKNQPFQTLFIFNFWWSGTIVATSARTMPRVKYEEILIYTHDLLDAKTVPLRIFNLIHVQDPIIKIYS